MDTTQSRRLSFGGTAAVLMIAVGLAVVAGFLLARQRAATWNGPTPPAQRITVDPFRLDAKGPHWSGKVLAESLVARLAGIPGLAVRIAGGSFGPAPDLKVGGDLALRDGRLVITAELFSDSGGDALWTATYWRKDSLSSELVGDLSAGIAEAIAAHLARRGGGREARKP